MLYGWDISTSIIGLSSFDDDGKYYGSAHLDLRKIDGQMAKADAFKEWISTARINSARNGESYHFIEERLGGFSGGRTSAQVLMKLAQFNAICSYILWNYNPGPHRALVYLHPSTWKSIMKREGLLIPKGSDKKALTLAFFQRKEPNAIIELNRNEKPQPWNYDVADSYCIGRAGFLKLCTEKERSSPSEKP
jgi:hypothetical protein